MKFQVNVARQMPSTKASATKGAANRRSYLESRRNSSAGKQPGANIDSPVLAYSFFPTPRHRAEDEARRGLVVCLSAPFIPIPWSVSASVLCNFPSRTFDEYLRRDLEALINPWQERSDRNNNKLPGPGPARLISQRNNDLARRITVIELIIERSLWFLGWNTIGSSFSLREDLRIDS